MSWQGENRSHPKSIGNMLFRTVGALLPVTAVLVILELGEHLVGDEVSSADIAKLFLVAALVGLIAGLLLRTWAALGLVPCTIPLMVALIYLYDLIDGGITEGRGGDPMPLSVAVIFLAGPFMIPAALGAWIGVQTGKRIEEWRT